MQKIVAGLLAAFLLPIGHVRAQQETYELATKPKGISVVLVDVDGKPVEGADLGVLPMTGAFARDMAAKDNTEWYYEHHARSDPAGVARFDNDARFEQLCLVARHERRKIVAVVSIDPAQLDQPVLMRLVPECEVSGEVVCKDFSAIGRELGPVVVEVSMAGKGALTCFPDKSEFRISLPPGDYELTAYGGGWPAWSTSSATHRATKTVRVEGNKSPQKLEPIELHATKLALLEGRPAPELQKVVAWKNSEPIELADLRGKCVLLDFWGYWCMPCVARMPKLFDLHDKYHEQGLTIIGIHVDIEDGPEGHVDTFEKLEEQLKEVRRSLWNNRDIPFPVALIAAQRIPYGDGIEGTARSPLAATYGILSYPTQVLIDRRGNVVRKFHPNEEGMKVLEATLNEK